MIGVGGVGSFAMQYARLAGARVIAAERSGRQARLGARSSVRAKSSTAPAAAPAVRDLTGGRGVDCVLDIVGTEATMAPRSTASPPAGRIVVVGYTPDVFA